MFTGIIGAVGDVNSIAACDGGGARMEVRCPPGWLRAQVGDSVAVDGVCLTVAEIGGDAFRAQLSPETLARVAPFRAGAKVNLEAALVAGAPLGGHFVGGHIDGVARVAANDADGECRRLMLAAPAGLRRYFAPKCAVAVAGVSLTVNQIGAMTDGDSGGGNKSGDDDSGGDSNGRNKSGDRCPTFISPPLAGGTEEAKKSANGKRTFTSPPLAGRTEAKPTRPARMRPFTSPPLAGGTEGGRSRGGKDGEFVFAVQLVPHTLAATTLGGLRSGDLANVETDMIARHLEALAESWRGR